MVTGVAPKYLLQERMRLSHLQKEKERLRQDPPISLLSQMIPPILPGEGNSGHSQFIIKQKLVTQIKPI